MPDIDEQRIAISLIERKFLQCLSIFWEPITAPDLQKFLKLFDLQVVESKSLSYQNVANFRNSLIDRRLLVNIKGYWGSGYQIPEATTQEDLTREALAEGWFDDAVRKIQTHFDLTEFKRWPYERERLNFRLLRDYRLSIYQKQTEKSFVLLELLAEHDLAYSARKVAIQIFSDPFQREFLNQFDRNFQGYILPGLIENAIEWFEPTEEFWSFSDENRLDEFQIVRGLKIEDLLLKGDLAEAKKLVSKTNTLGAISAAATIAFLEKNYAKAIELFEESVKLWRTSLRKKKGFPETWQLFFYGLALFKTDEPRYHKFVGELSAYALKTHPYSTAALAIQTVAYFLKNNERSSREIHSQMDMEGFDDQILQIIVAAIIPDLPQPYFAESLRQRCRISGYKWVEYEAANLQISKGQTDVASEFERLKNELAFEPAGNSIPRMEDWERALMTLAMVAQKAVGKAETKASINETRIVWQLDFNRREIQPVEQTFSKRGWTKGRNVSLKRLNERDVKNLTEQDARVVKNSLKRYQGGYYGGYEFEFLWPKAIEALVDHPLLFLMANPSVNVQLVKAEPNLVIKEIGDDLELSFDTAFTEEGAIIEKETEARYKVIKISKDHVEIAESLKNGKLRVPAGGREMLLKAIQPLTTKIAVQSDLEEHFENLPSVESENRIHALITPGGDGFHLEFFVKPFGTVPPYFKPGKGAESVIADVSGVRTRTKRNLNSERKLLDEIEGSCPFLAGFESQNYEWELVDAEECLTAMSELETPRKAGQLVVEWTKGQKLKLLGNISYSNFSLAVKGRNDWFEVAGEARVSEDLVLSMRELSLLLNENAKNFIELSDGQFIAITEKLRKHLQSLTAAMDEKNRLHNLRTGILEDFSDELENFKTDKAWKNHLERIRAARSFVPELPATFEADLRPYQIDGYNWLSRLANWGVGACLADDMGLGKTLQALAVLVERAEKGAALVVAPVSVCRNWVREAIRFSPTLNFQIFGGGDRKATVESLGKYDVLVTSYNLLQSEEELFTSLSFATIVLDEAQAIKNRHTKRSHAVMALQGDFRLITTGTPIENHLGELWNLFNFINPGLLGSHEFFSDKFALPIEKTKDDNSRKTLQKLIKPFMLRRRKNQVLEDLPAKTEIVLSVELSEEERAFYEAIRREALEKIEAAGGEAKDKRFRILAELTRLRLACCHPKLVNKNIPISGSKLELFGETLEELLENKHKALVFSQFVKHLKIIEEYLQAKGVKYHYLDGSTPAHIRQERIDAFQRGESEVFLISLKAGGTGLNLTAADYVIHLDPWWNPAVEDQATDRVHRIGQQRPVTVYRLVTENTVEEKILKLHETKRDLADSLLDGTDTSGKLSADDLLALISEA